MSKEIAASQYQQLLSDISAIYQHAHKDINTTLTKSYFEIGKKIIEVEQQGRLRAEYGAHLIDNLSRDLSQQLGKGFSRTNLCLMRKFYLKHKDIGPSFSLPWSQHCILLRIENDGKRQDYEKIASEQHLSKNRLSTILNKELKTFEKYSQAVQFDVGMIRERPQLTGPVLPVSTGRLQIFRVIELRNVPVGEGVLVLDLGFNVRTQVLAPNGLDVDIGDIIEVNINESGVIIERSSIRGSQLFSFKAFVERVVDGDTLTVNIDAGFGVWIRQNLRLRHINCAEIKTAEGLAARAFVEKELSKVSFVVVRTRGRDMYGRYLADVNYLSGENDPEKVNSSGKFLNQEILDAGYAEIVKSI